MIVFLWNLLLAILWAAITGEFNLATLGLGFVIGYLILFISSRALGQESYFRKTRLFLPFLFFVAYKLFLSSLHIAFDILTPKHRMRPGIIKIPIDAHTDFEITLLSNLISLTPGTLTLDISDDRKTLYMHAMYIQDNDIEGVRRHIKNDFERKVLELLR